MIAMKSVMCFNAELCEIKTHKPIIIMVQKKLGSHFVVHHKVQSVEPIKREDKFK